MRFVLVGAAALFALALAGTTAATAEPLTLEQAMALAYETNPQLQGEQANLRATDEGVARARSGWRPTIAATGTYGWSRSETDGVVPGGTETELSPKVGALTVTQPIFSGGRTWANVSRAQALVRAGRANLIAAEQQTLLDAVTAFMNVVRDQATAELRKNNVAVLKRQLQAADDRFRVGEITRTDVAQAQARLSGATAALTAAEAQLAASRSNFERVVGRTAEALVNDAPFPAVPPTEEQALDIALQKNPLLIAAREADRAADYAVDSALGGLLPSLSVRGEYERAEDTFGRGIQTESMSVMGTLSVPLYQAGAEHATVREAKERRSQARLDVTDAERAVREALRSTFEAYRSSQAAITFNEEQVRANEIAYEGVQQEAQVGARTTLDALNAEQELLDSRVALVTSRRNAYVAAYQLLAALGGLTAQALGLPVTIYDPVEHYDDVSGAWIGLGD